MPSERRDFLFGTPLAILALLEAGELPATGAVSSQPQDPAALDFWTRGMGLSHSEIPTSGAMTRGGSGGKNSGPGSTVDFAREPIFLHYHEGEKALLQASQLQKSFLLDAGDAQVSMQMQRLRLNSADQVHFSNYTSGGIYLELQQAQQTAKAASANSEPEALLQLASSVFSAFFPGTSGKSKKDSKGSDASGGKPKTGAKSFLQSGGGGKGAQAGAAIALQTAKQAQSLPLPNGAGKVAFSAFVKDPRKSAFGQFIAALTSADGSSAAYAPLLSLSLLAAPALSAVRAIVANMQLQGGNQQILIQSPPIDIAATAVAMDALSNPLPLRGGDYIVIPREQAPLMKDQLTKFKIMNGFLVPKDADDLDVTPEMVGDLIPGLTYLSVNVKVKKTKINSCSAG